MLLIFAVFGFNDGRLIPCIHPIDVCNKIRILRAITRSNDLVISVPADYSLVEYDGIHGSVIRFYIYG